MPYAITDPRHSDLVCFYTFEDTSGKDEAGNYPAGFIGNWYEEAGQFNKAQRAADLNAYVQIANLGTWFAGRSTFTVSFWDEIPIAWANTDFVFAVSNTSHSNPYYRFVITLRDTGITVRVNGYTGGANVSYTWPAEAPVGRHHYAFRFNAGTLDIFFDGVLVKSQSGLGTTIGGCYPTAMMGRIPAVNSSVNAAAINRDQFRVFGPALTDTQIGELYNEQPIHIAGTVTLDGSPLSTTVRVYDEADGALIGFAQSDANGDYSIPVYTYDPVYVMAVGGSGRRPLVHGPVIPLDQI